MKIQELRNKQTEELHKILKQNRDKLRDLRFRLSQKQVKNIREIREVKKIIARVLMLLKQRQKPASPVSPSTSARDKNQGENQVGQDKISTNK